MLNMLFESRECVENPIRSHIRLCTSLGVLPIQTEICQRGRICQALQHRVTEASISAVDEAGANFADQAPGH